jgi:hypothetical protein
MQNSRCSRRALFAAMVCAARQMKTPVSRLRAGFADEKIGIVLTCERDFERKAATS